ncbi:MAG TPA: hypothetical protein VF520_04660 [Thermoleophilaceae bacterium]
MVSTRKCRSRAAIVGIAAVAVLAPAGAGAEEPVAAPAEQTAPQTAPAGEAAAPQAPAAAGEATPAEAAPPGEAGTTGTTPTPTKAGTAEAAGDKGTAVCGTGGTPDCDKSPYPHPTGSIEVPLDPESVQTGTRSRRRSGRRVATRTRTISFAASIRRLEAAARRGPVNVAKRELVLEDGKVAVELGCLAGSLDRVGEVTLVQVGDRRLELAAGELRCDRLGLVTLELPASPELAKLLEAGDVVRARLVVVIGGRTIRTPVTIAAD